MACCLSIVTGLIENPRQTAMGIVAVCNLILLGFGYWWQANALKQFAAVVTASMLIGYTVNNCLKLNPIYSTIFFMAPALCGYFGVRAYWCLKQCGGYPGGASPDIGIDHCEVGGSCWIDFAQYSWDPSLPWYMSFFSGILDWIANLVNFIPELIMWINMIVGIVFVIVSLAYWRWSEVCTSLFTCCGICNRREDENSSYDDKTYDDGTYPKATGNHMPLLSVGTGGTAGAAGAAGAAVAEMQRIACDGGDVEDRDAETRSDKRR